GQGAERLDRAVALHHHGDQRAAGDELDQRGEERLVGVLLVVALGGLLVQGAQLKRDDPESLALDAGDDVADDVAAHAVGLDQDKGALHGSSLLDGSFTVHGATGRARRFRAAFRPGGRYPTGSAVAFRAAAEPGQAPPASCDAPCIASTRRPRTTPAIHRPTKTMPR